MLTVLLLGAPQVILDGQPLDSLRRKNRALLYYLASRDEPLTRDEALAFFWPDHPRPAAQRALRTMLSELRRHLGPALLAEAETLALSADAVVDARRFEAGLSARAPSASDVDAPLETE
jgi:DNA-binding SARP family transcriptional activator